MNVTITKLPQSRARLLVELDPDEVQPYLEAAARDLSKEHPIKGFRPGAVPLDAMRSHMGDEALVERALQKLVPRTYVDALLDRDDIEAIGRPEVAAQSVAVGQAWTYEATVAILPDVQLGNYKRLRGTVNVATVDPQEVERELQTLQKMRASYLSVVRPVATGDRVEVTIRATLDGVPLDPESSPRQPMMVGEGHLVPGFEEQILGMREGETKTFTLTFPENHHRKDLRDRAVEFTATVALVQQRVLPEPDDTFAKGLGNFSSVANLKEKLTENLRLEKEEKERQRFQLDLLKQVVDTTTFGEFPDILIHGEVEKMLSELSQGLSASGLTLEQYLPQIGKTLDEVREGFKPQAQDRIRAGLTLRALAKVERVTVGEKEVSEEVKKVLEQFPSAEEAKKHVDLNELTGVATGTVRNRKVFALLEQFAAPA